ncbi:protocadherin beta-15-like isoform X1 [Octopus vulgaris]|uniref:Protocadherin beta-15-like isoform X1 n=1 Tax=Octopus vulgaris TaxID=6645 RepID=A0AA36BMZ0_OCTVU|nr:protocadherin beta-15-like isoform X1 [Octopus vulgaris]
MLNSWSLVFMVLLTASNCQHLTYTVMEGEKPGTYLGNIAFDTSLMKNVGTEERNLRFILLKPAHSTEHQQLFKINEKTGKFYTAQVIDAEAVCTQGSECFQIVDVIVQDGEALLKILKIKIVIEDINDNKPIFPRRNINLYFSEGGSGMRKSIPNAVDQDVSEKNSKISYHLQSKNNETFSLIVTERIDGTSKLSINVNKKLDREVRSSYVLEIIAQDGGQPPLQTHLNVNISVTDVNDNAPVFMQDVYNVTIKNELSKQTPIITVSATDADKDENGKVSYRFSSRTSEITLSHFQLNGTTGEIFFRRIFSSSEKYMHLFIEAYDGANPPLSVIGMVQVNIQYTTNNPPEIRINFVSSVAPNTAIVSEDINEGSFIAYVQVFDHDVGNNGQVSCNLRHDHFQLQSLGSTGYKVIVKKRIDREKKDNFNVTVTCQDKGIPALFTDYSFLIEVSDVNDNAPLFEKSSYTASFFENNVIGLSIVKVSAYDKDKRQNAQITYFLQSDLPFSIGKLSGIIRAKTSFDREASSFLTFPVFAKDQGNPSLTGSATLKISILDVNDKSPKFTQPTFEFSTYENQQPNFPVGFINATDADQGINSQLTYSLIRNKGSFIPFQISNDGFLSVVQVLDRELQPEYRFKVLVNDKGTPSLNNTVNVRVKVIDENDNSPEFVFPSGNNFSMTVYYQRYTNKEISIVQAHDNDVGKNAVLRYNIIGGNEKKLFDIDTIKGSIYFARAATAQDSGLYKLQLIVFDSGEPVNSAESNLSLSVIVNNDTAAINKGFEPHTGITLQHNLLIVIVLTVITVSVAIIVITTICVIRRNDVRNATTIPQVSNNSDHSQTLSKQFTFNSDPSLRVPKGNGRRNRCGYNYSTVPEDVGLGCNTSAISENSNHSTGVNKAQVTFQNVVAATNRSVHDCMSDISTGSSNNDSGRGWSDADAGTVQELQSMAENVSPSSQCAIPLLNCHQKSNTVPVSFTSRENGFKPNQRSSFKPNSSSQNSPMNNLRSNHHSLPMNTNIHQQQGSIYQKSPYSTSQQVQPSHTPYSLVAIPIRTIPNKLHYSLVQPQLMPKQQVVSCGANLSQAETSFCENQSSSSTDSCHLLDDLKKHTYSDRSNFVLKDVIV